MMFSVFNAGFLCAMRVFYVATRSSVYNAGFLCACDTGLLRSYRVICVQCGFSMQLSGLLQAVRVFSVANGFSVYVVSSFFFAKSHIYKV